MIKNSPNAKYLAVQNLNAPSLDDVGKVRAAVEQNSKTPSDGPLRVKEDGNGFLFLSSKLIDKHQAPSAYKASVTGKDRNIAHDFFRDMCDAISGDTNNTDSVVKASDELARHIHDTQPKHGEQRTVDDTKAFRQKLIALDEARKAQNRERALQNTPTRDARHESRKATLETFRSPLPSENEGIELEAHTLELPSFKEDATTSTQRPQGKRKLPRRRPAEKPAVPDSSVNVDKAMSGYIASPAIRQLSIDTVRRLATKESLTDNEKLQLAVARSYLKESAPIGKPWDPMTEIRLEVDLPPDYFPPRK
ncbi:MAG TPA: hypothetical protein VLG41_11490 [Hydrogenophaga sp.]|uniref:hypothetical protein n=1 Tax=Hydrogenophaga sp. TaxID=1904254 RepID=UPI002C76E356|nr:hypothetical protein [Hydrogenophaga sp.]HSX93539.1 hypothetical protein [Hydrogenophaga sp.]